MARILFDYTMMILQIITLVIPALNTKRPTLAGRSVILLGVMHFNGKLGVFGRA